MQSLVQTHVTAIQTAFLAAEADLINITDPAERAAVGRALEQAHSGAYAAFVVLQHKLPALGGVTLLSGPVEK